MNNKSNNITDTETFAIEEFGEDALILRVKDMHMFQVPFRVVHLIKVLIKFKGNIEKTAINIKSNKKKPFKEIKEELRNIWKELHSNKKKPTKK